MADETRETRDGSVGCGAAQPASAIQPRMDVIAACGTRVGTVDHLDGEAVKLARRDSPDGHHHRVPLEWVARVDKHVHLNKNAADVRREWEARP